MKSQSFSRRVFVIVILLSLIATLNGGISAQAAPDTTALVAVFIPTPASQARFNALELPIYKYVQSEVGEFLLTSAKSSQLSRLTVAELSFRMIDPDIKKADYYLAYAPIGRVAPDWSLYGKVLLDGGSVVVLQAAPSDAAKLPDTGAEIAAITLSPKPQTKPPLTSLPTVITPDPLIQAMISRVTLMNVRSYTGGVSGEWPVTIGGQPYTILTRNTYSGESIQKATQYVGENLANFGLDVEYHQWGGATYPNVIGELPGLTDPDNIYIIGAHLDNMPSSGRAPGADDNGSGSVATLLAANILSRYQWGCTLRFAFWTGEEQGLNGSEAYALRAHNAGENILGYLNLDMIAWNEGGSAPGIDLLYNPNMPATLSLAQLFADAVDAYNINLTPQFVTSLGGGSDHSSFWDQGYTAILAIEDQSDFNPYYHTINDDMDNFEDWGYYVNFIQASIGTFAHMSGCLVHGPLDGNIAGTVTDALTGDGIANVAMTTSPEHGTTNTDGQGDYTISLPPATYALTAQHACYISDTIESIVVSENSTTVQDVVLQPLPPVAQVSPITIQAELIVGDSITSTLSIENLGCSNLTYTATEIAPAPWLALQNATGVLEPTATSIIEAELNASSLAPGIYTTTINIETTDPNQANIAIPVSLSVEATCAPAHPVAQVSPSAIQVELTAGSQLTPTVNLENLGCSSLIYTATDTTPVTWLTLQHAAGSITPSANENIELALNTTEITAGVYTTSISIQTNDPEHANVTIPVSLNVNTACTPVSDLDFEWFPLSPIIGENVTFTASVAGTQPISLTWSLGEQNIGDGEVITFAFASAGDQNITLSASNACSANVQTSHSLFVWLRKIFLPLILASSQQ